jgi:hypothetical protein
MAQANQAARFERRSQAAGRRNYPALTVQDHPITLPLQGGIRCPQIQTRPAQSTRRSRARCLACCPLRSHPRAPLSAGAA